MKKILKVRLSTIKMIFLDFFNRNRILSVFYASILNFFKVRDDLVFLEAGNGRGFNGSPFYMLLYMLGDARFSKFSFVIVGNEDSLLSRLEVGSLKRVIFVPYRSLRYCFYLAISKYLINDVTFPLFFLRRDAQKYLNLWHGTPLKAMGRRCVRGNFSILTNTQRNFLHSTHILYPNKHTGDVLLRDYMIGDLWSGTLLQCGYPRNDVFFSDMCEKKGHDYNVAFMPTWRGELDTVRENSEAQVQELQELLDVMDRSLSGGVKLWVKLHGIALAKLDFSDWSVIEPFPSELETYEHLASCDMLITDYSSVMFDFSAMHKPILLYTPDEEQYKKTRGFSIDFDSLPFERAYTALSLLALIEKYQGGCAYDYQKFVDIYCRYDKGRSAEIISTTFVLGINEVDQIYHSPSREKPRLLFFPGSFLNNGITSSFKSLLSNLDFKKYSVHVYVEEKNAKKYPEIEKYFQNLPAEVSYFPVRNMLLASLFEACELVFKELFGRRELKSDKLYGRLYQREKRRIFSVSDFDLVIHFCGYARRFSSLLFGFSSKKIVYFHNDIYSEIKNRAALDARKFKLAYDLADAVAVVWPGLERNYCTHVDDISRKVKLVTNTLNVRCLPLSQMNIEASLSSDNTASVINKAKYALLESSSYKFVNVARYSYEKGQARLIKAFERIWASNPDCQLFIIGGHGDRYEKILNLSLKSPASKNIHVLIGTDNPFPIMKKMDCFVFSSFYEGIGLVMYEALALGLPVISTNIPGPADFLSQGYGLLVENSVDGLVDGMIKALSDKLPRKEYNFVDHNLIAVRQFDNLVADVILGPGIC